jgi:dissimilatory sulfite reductase alpha subunit
MGKAARLPNAPLLDELEDGPWPSFLAGIKRLAETKPMAADLLGQLETSYETRKGYWKGGTVGVFGYAGGIIPRFTERRSRRRNLQCHWANESCFRSPSNYERNL